jgi:hypothetical protein
MQTKLERGRAAFHIRGVGLSVAILAGVPLVTALALFAPEQAFAACGGSSSGVHTASTHTGSHTTTSIAPSSGASSGGGSGSLGCSNGSSATGLKGLATATSGRVTEGGAVGRRETRATAPTRTNATAHLHTVVRPSHHA